MAQTNNLVGQVFEQLGEIPKKAASDTVKAVTDIAAKAVEQGIVAALPTSVQQDQAGKQREQGQSQQQDPAKLRKMQEDRRRFQQVKSEIEQYQRKVVQQKQQETAIKQQEEQQKQQQEFVKKKEKESFLTRLLNKASSESTGETMRKPS